MFSVLGRGDRARALSGHLDSPPPTKVRVCSLPLAPRLPNPREEHPVFLPPRNLLILFGERGTRRSSPPRAGACDLVEEIAAVGGGWNGITRNVKLDVGFRRPAPILSLTPVGPLPFSVLSIFLFSRFAALGVR